MTNHPLRSKVAGALLIAAISALSVAPVEAADPRTKRVSQKKDGTHGDSYSYVYRGGISRDGRFVAFESYATNLVANDDNEDYDVFVWDRATRRLKHVSVRSNGDKANDSAEYPVISSNGRIVAFEATASNLVPGDTLGHEDIFIHNLKNGNTRRVSLRSNGDEANSSSNQVAISGSGRYVTFQSQADNLVRQDDNGLQDIFVHDRRRGKTTRVSVRSNGDEANAPSEEATISDNGRFVVFHSEASNLVVGDEPNTYDVFIHDRETGKTKRVSLKSNGDPANGTSLYGVSSNNGRLIAFESEATNLASGDTSDVDVFVHNRRTGKTKLVNVRPDGREGNGPSQSPDITPSGRFVTFMSGAEDLIPGVDDNGVIDVYVYDRRTDKMRLVSRKRSGAQTNEDAFDPAISNDGAWVAFYSDGVFSGSESGPKEADVFLRGPLR